MGLCLHAYSDNGAYVENQQISPICYKEGCGHLRDTLSERKSAVTVHMPRKVLATAVAVFCLSYLTIDLLRRLSLTVNSSQFLRLSQLRPSAARSAIPGLLKFHSNQSDADMTVYAQQTKQRSQFLGEISVCSAIIQLYIICMWITRCNNHDLYNGACGMFGNTGMIIHINATLTCVGLNAFCTHLIPGCTCGEAQASCEQS